MSEFTFYDNEASGVLVRHDQVTQFGGVTCDESFRIKDSISLFVRLLPYVVPHPQALFVTGKTPYDVCNPNLVSEYRAAMEVSRFLTPPRGVRRVFITYNGIRYDDELLRTMLYRNLQNPYFNSGRDCLKIDLFPVVQLVSAADPTAIVIPKDSEGKPSFRLEKICPANGIEIDAHDAHRDSVATMHLFQLIQRRAPWAIDLALECGSTQAAEKLLSSSIASGEPLFRFTHFGKPDFTPLAITASDGKKKYLGIDLRFGKCAEDSGKIAEQLYKPDTPFQVITTNKFPLLLTPDRMRSVLGNEPTESLVQRAREINHNSGLKAACKDAASRNTLEKVNAPTSEERIYDGFFDGPDMRRITEFNRASSWIEKAKIPFADKRLRDFSARIILEAAGNGEVALSPTILRSLALDCSEALCRPFGSAKERHPTIAKCIADGTDDAWMEWARGRFGDHPVMGTSPRVMDQAPKADQMSFTF